MSTHWSLAVVGFAVLTWVKLPGGIDQVASASTETATSARSPGFASLPASTQDLQRPSCSLTEIEPWGQDVDGDGIATTAEGEYDFDGDGEFTKVEALWLGVDTFVRWMPKDEFDRMETAGTLQSMLFARVCASACIDQGGGPICVSNLSSVNCIDNGGLCYSVPCGYPCSCPAPGGGG